MARIGKWINHKEDVVSEVLVIPQRLVPEGAKRARFTAVGMAPMLVHAPTMLDPFAPVTREIKALTSKRARTVDDEMAIARLEWEAALYHDEQLGPYVPGPNVKAALRDAAKFWKRGAAITRALMVVEWMVPIAYDGPRDRDGLWDQGYRDVRSVVNGGVARGRVSRCRPCFESWELMATIAWLPEELDFDFLERVVARAQGLGIGDFRPDFGAFDGQLELLDD